MKSKRPHAAIALEILSSRISKHCEADPVVVGEYADGDALIKYLEIECRPLWQEKQSGTLLPEHINPVEKWISRTHKYKLRSLNPGYITIVLKYMTVITLIHCLQPVPEALKAEKMEATQNV